MASGGRVDRGSRLRARAESVVVPFPRLEHGARLDLARLVPSGRSLAIAFATFGLALLTWLGARETGVFAVRTIEVGGAPPGVALQVRRALRSLDGTSLLKLDLGAAERTVEALPAVESVVLDRAFPHGIAVDVTPEQPAAVVRQGSSSYLVSRRARVVATVSRSARPNLPRVWVRRDVELEPGAIARGELAVAIAAVAPLAGSGFPARVRSVSASPSELTLRLRSGLELQLGDPRDTALKLSVAARVLPLLEDDVLYLDVSVPERPVAGTQNKAQLELESTRAP